MLYFSWRCLLPYWLNFLCSFLEMKIFNACCWKTMNYYKQKFSFSMKVFPPHEINFRSTLTGTFPLSDFLVRCPADLWRQGYKNIDLFFPGLSRKGVSTLKNSGKDKYSRGPELCSSFESKVWLVCFLGVVPASNKTKLFLLQGLISDET